MVDGWRNRLMAPLYAFGVACAVALGCGFVLNIASAAVDPQKTEVTIDPTPTSAATTSSRPPRTSRPSPTTEPTSSIDLPTAEP